MHILYVVVVDLFGASEIKLGCTKVLFLDVYASLGESNDVTVKNMRRRVSVNSIGRRVLYLRTRILDPCDRNDCSSISLVLQNASELVQWVG